MNILFCSVPFRPSVGGIETVSALLAERFQRQGHRVILVTQTAGVPADSDEFDVVRRPSVRRLCQLVGWADVVFHNNISLRFAWPQLLMRRPWVVAHHTWIPTLGLAGRIKRLVIRRASNIAVSHAVAKSLPVPSVIIPNPYADDLFVRAPAARRSRELVFVGRLVSDKGVAVLIAALGQLASCSRRVGLTVVGDGPELAALRRQASDLGVSEQIDFCGRRVGSELVSLLNDHQVLVVPSVWQEPFGVVALEAMACGCIPLVSRSGGLPDAIGGGGVVVPLGDIDALARAIDGLLGNSTQMEHLRSAAPAHLERHTRDRVARDYLHIISDVCHVKPSQSAESVV
ncbi:MAG: glycosyltransferase family 4 protein [Rhizobacter sp.]